MKERPILFSGPMILAILDGRKTMTRRVVKPAVPDEFTTGATIRLACTFGGVEWWNKSLGPPVMMAARKNPYGTVGDRLWVRETFQWCQNCATLNFAADTQRHCKGCDAWLEGPKRPSIFLSRMASRITLEITSVRVERVNEITEEDCLAEGIEHNIEEELYYHGGEDALTWMSAHGAFRELWDSINSKRGFGWDANSWVWVVGFRRVTK